MIKEMKTIYQYRFLVKQLVSRDIKLKYRRSFLGYLWSILNPLLIMIVMSIVFSKMFRFDISNYPAYLIIGQTLFSFMTESTNQAIFSITDNAALIKKVYVPKYIFTLSKVTSSLVNLLFSLGAMIIVFIISKIRFNLCMFMIPIIIFELYIFCMGLGLLLAQLSVFFRDIQYIYAVITTAWLYLTPIFYPIEQIPETLCKWIKLINPMYNYINQFRTVVLNSQLPSAQSILQGILVGLFLLFFGSVIFQKTQNKFILYL